jgi:tetratricopeptide (TPR) repeat protein
MQTVQQSLGSKLMFEKTFYCSILLASLTFATVAQAVEEPSLHEVYAAAEAGRYSDAQAMMDKVLQDHPNSAKAHFVEAELLAKQGRIANASAELSTAESLAPGLPFAKPESVQKLKQRIAGMRNTMTSTPMMQTPAASVNSGVSWGALLLGGGLIGALIYFARALMMRRNASVYAGSSGGVTTGPGYAGPVVGSNNGTMSPSGGSGLGSSIMGGLATGAAVGAGMVAGEALVHHLMDGNRHDNPSVLTPQNDSYTPDDMGGSDFGVNDSSSWDDSSGGGSGGDDW